MTEGTKQDATDLLLPSLLAMDVYHRDVAGGLYLEVDKRTTAIDTATPVDARANDVIGFYAKAYSVGDKIYISYRGTDDGSLVPGNLFGLPAAQTLASAAHAPLKDLYYGYPVAIGLLTSLGGSYENSQAIEAIKFYQKIRNSAGGKEIVVVGQSLGGGLELR
jgi:hypothetical protein